MYLILLTLGAIAAAVGALLLSNATQGVGIIAVGCFLGIAARIVQASTYEKRRERGHVERPHGV